MSVCLSSFDGQIVQLIIWETKNMNVEGPCLTLSQANKRVTCEFNAGHKNKWAVGYGEGLFFCNKMFPRTQKGKKFWRTKG